MNWNDTYNNNEYMIIYPNIYKITKS